MFAGDAIFGNCEFVDLIHKVQLDYTKADISFTASMSYSDTIQKGVFTMADLFKLYRFDNLLYTIELSGQEIKDYLEYSYANWFNSMKKYNDSLLHLSVNKKGKHYLTDKYYNFSSAAGINYTINLEKEIGNRIEISGFVNNTPFDLDKEYKVAINSYRANGGGGHLIEGAKIKHENLHKRIITKSELDLRSIIMNWIKKKGVITPRAMANWKAIPVPWWKSGKRKTLNLLSKNKKR